ncbi:hypothetical protein [Williamsia sterculiae]|uniref:Uncharacterized protein n=1 Tax=Williamsia sterculiae TaxID=1344003 RepID=A0A1N7FXE2_9NOCA|nr:hypothetical protein [Williamsia sterculiae]SIS05028.1 hypothetical protein SAMN05445060_2381 [Williamsia sterculiae]
MTRFARIYGSSPWHLLTLTAGFAALVAAVATMKPAALWNPASWWQSIAVWFVAAIVAHDLVAFPVYALADRILHRNNGQHPRAQHSVGNYVRLPAIATALTFLIFLPGIIRQGGLAYKAATGQTQDPYLARWLWLTAGFFVTAAVAYSMKLLRDRYTAAKDPTAEL